MPRQAERFWHRPLRRFDRFLAGQDCRGGLLREEHFRAYLSSFRPSRHDRFGVVGQFSRYLHAVRPGNAVCGFRRMVNSDSGDGEQ